MQINLSPPLPLFLLFVISFFLTHFSIFTYTHYIEASAKPSWKNCASRRSTWCLWRWRTNSWLNLLSTLPRPSQMFSSAGWAWIYLRVITLPLSARPPRTSMLLLSSTMLASSPRAFFSIYLSSVIYRTTSATPQVH